MGFASRESTTADNWEKSAAELVPNRSNTNHRPFQLTSSPLNPSRAAPKCRKLEQSEQVQIESTAGEDEYKVWLTPDEEQQLEEYAKDRSAKHYAVVLLGGRIGLRAQEIAAMQYDHLREEGDHYRLRVPESAGKDTTGTGGKARDAWVPSDAERELLRIRFELDEDDDEPLLGVQKRRVRQIVEELGEELAEETGTTDWAKLSSHDLRRYYAQTLLVREDTNPHVVMTIGGWSSLDALTPYLTRPTDEQIRDEMVSAGWD